MHIRIRRVVGEPCGGLSSEMVYLNLCLKYSANRSSVRKSQLNGHYERPLRAGPSKFGFSTDRLDALRRNFSNGNCRLVAFANFRVSPSDG